MNISNPKTKQISLAMAEGSNLFFYGLLAYTAMFYSQIAGRFPFLAPLRLEFVLGSILVLAAFSKLARGSVSFQENKLNIAAVLFFLVAFVNIPLALVKTHALNTFIDLFKFFAIYLMIIVTIHDEKRLKGFVYVYLCMITLLFIEPFFLSLQGKGFIYNNHMWRLAGVTNYFGHPNQLGGITAENLPFFYFLMRYDKSIIRKGIYFALILIALRVIMLTQSRTGFLTVAMFGGCIWLFSKNKVLSLFVIILFCGVLWHFAPQQTKDRLLTFSKVDEIITSDSGNLEGDDLVTYGSMANRWELIRRGFICFLENPLIGVGMNCFSSFNGRRWNYWFPPHNTYIQSLAEMGMIGFIAFMYVIFISFKNLNNVRNILRVNGETNTFLASITSAVTVYLMLRIVVSMFGQDLYANYWWLAGGLSLVLLRIVREKYEHPVTDNVKGNELTMCKALDGGQSKQA